MLNRASPLMHNWSVGFNIQVGAKTEPDSCFRFISTFRIHRVARKDIRLSYSIHYLPAQHHMPELTRLRASSLVVFGCILFCLQGATRSSLGPLYPHSHRRLQQIHAKFSPSSSKIQIFIQYTVFKSGFLPVGWALASWLGQMMGWYIFWFLSINYKAILHDIQWTQGWG